MKAKKILDIISSSRVQSIRDFEDILKSFHEELRISYPEISIPPTIHYVICHGPAVFRFMGGRTGHLSEEAQERTNKILRKARLNHTRKIGPLEVMEDLSNWLYQRSDPLM